MALAQFCNLGLRIGKKRIYNILSTFVCEGRPNYVAGYSYTINAEYIWLLKPKTVLTEFVIVRSTF